MTTQVIEEGFKEWKSSLYKSPLNPALEGLLTRVWKEAIEWREKKEDEQNADILKMTGFKNKDVWDAHEAGYNAHEKIMMEWIGEWDGQVNSVLGSLLQETFKRVYVDAIVKKIIEEVEPKSYTECIMKAIKSIEGNIRVVAEESSAKL